MFPKLKGKFLLAPMSGVTDVYFRLIARKYGAAMTYTEFCSSEGIIRSNDQTIKQAVIDKREKPVGIQLFGSSAESVRKAAELMEKKADVIDFNLGCPAWHILSQGCGSALMSNPDKIKNLVSEVSSTLTKPFTVKMRLGLDNKKKNYLEVAAKCVDAGASAVTLHARTTKQGYSGKADWSAIKLLKEELSVPVIGNGDVFTPEDAIKMLQTTNCDYVMIGRGARTNPFIFKQANELLKKGHYSPVSDTDKINLFYEYYNLAREKVDFFRIKSHAMSLLKGLKGASNIRRELALTRSDKELLGVIKAYG